MTGLGRCMIGGVIAVKNKYTVYPVQWMVLYRSGARKQRCTVNGKGGDGRRVSRRSRVEFVPRQKGQVSCSRARRVLTVCSFVYEKDGISNGTRTFAPAMVGGFGLSVSGNYGLLACRFICVYVRASTLVYRRSCCTLTALALPRTLKSRARDNVRKSEREGVRVRQETACKRERHGDTNMHKQCMTSMKLRAGSEEDT